MGTSTTGEVKNNNEDKKPGAKTEAQKEAEKKRREELIEANQKFFTDKEAQDRPRGLRYFHEVVHVGQAEKPAEEAGDDADAAVSLSSTHPGFSRLKPGGNEMVYRIQGKESDRVSIWFSEDSSKVILSKPPSFGSSNYDKQWGAVYDAYKLGGYAYVEFDFPGREGKPLTKTQLQIILEHQRMALERGLPLQLDGALLQAVFAARENKGLFGNAKLAEAIYQQHVTNWPHNDTDKKKKKTQDDTNLAAYEIKLRDVTRDVTKANDAYQKAKVAADTLYGQFEEKKNDVELRQKYEVAKDTANKARETLNNAIVTAEKAFAGVKKEVEEQGVDVEGAKGYKKVIEERQKEIDKVKEALSGDAEMKIHGDKLSDAVKTAAKSAELATKSPDERLREKSDAFDAAIESSREAPTKESVQAISDAVAALRGEAMKGDVKDAALTALKDKIDGAVRAVNTLEIPRDAEVRKAFDVMQTQVQYTDDVVKLSAGGMLAQIQRETRLVELRRGLISDITDDNGMKFGEVRGELDRLRDKQREVAQDRKAYLERCEQLLDAGAEPASLKDYTKRMEQFKQHEEVLKSGVRGMEDVIVAERDKEPVSATPAQNTWAHLLDEHDKYKKTMAERAKADDARLAERGAKSLQERMDERMKAASPSTAPGNKPT